MIPINSHTKIYTYTKDNFPDPWQIMLKHLLFGRLTKDAGWFLPSFISGEIDIIMQRDLLKGGVYTPGVGDVVTTTGTLYWISDKTKEQDSSIPKNAVASIEHNIGVKTADGRIYVEPEGYNKVYFGYDQKEKAYYSMIDGEYHRLIGPAFSLGEMFDWFFSQGVYYRTGCNEAPYQEPTDLWDDYS